MRRQTMGADYFCDLYARDADPWKFASSDYERHKYEATLNALPMDRHARGLEVGCSIGVFTSMLAPRCESLVAIDPAERALEEARLRCAPHRNIAFATMQAPGEWPAGTFDLIVLSEVLYFFGRALIGQLAERVEGSLQNPSHVLLVHWLGETDYPLSGDDAVTEFVARTGSFLRIISQQRTAEYRLDLLEPFRRPSQSLQCDLGRMDLAGQIARCQRSTREARANPFQLSPDNRKRLTYRQFARVIRLEAEPIHPR